MLLHFLTTCDIIIILYKEELSMKKTLFAIALASITLCSCGSTPPGNTPPAEPPAPIEHTVSISYWEQATLVFYDEQTVEQGNDITIAFQGYDNPYTIVSVLVDGEEQLAHLSNGSLTLNDVAKDTNVSVKYGLGIPYVAPSNAPVIDGQADDIYDKATSFYCTNWSDEDYMLNQLEAEIKVVWNETGLYFLGIISDADVNALDRCNFWVSETYNPNSIDDYSPYPKDGNYGIFINPEADNLLYTSLDVSSYWTSSATKFESGYIVEVYMPVIGDNPLVAGNSIGFDISVDYYSSSSTDRQFYAYWMGLTGTWGNYWNCVGALAEVKLLP